MFITSQKPAGSTVKNYLEGAVDKNAYVEVQIDTPATLREAAKTFVWREGLTLRTSVASGFKAAVGHWHTWVMLSLSFFCVAVCQRSSFLFPVEWSILATAIVFPMTFAVRRDHNLVHISFIICFEDKRRTCVLQVIDCNRSVFKRPNDNSYRSAKASPDANKQTASSPACESPVWASICCTAIRIG